MSQAQKAFENRKKKATDSVAPHLVIIARAGTGKTTTLIQGLKGIKGMDPTLLSASEAGQEIHITPSPQQKAIWDEMKRSENAKSVCFVAFNKSIATELGNKIPLNCDAMTMHSMGNRALCATYGYLEVNEDRVDNILERLMALDLRKIKRHYFEMLITTKKLVSLCKMNLTLDCIDNDGVFVDKALDDLAAHYDIDLNDNRTRVYDLVPKVLEACKNVYAKGVEADGQIDFDDMIWLPIVLGLDIKQYDLLLVDEAQDLNCCQQALAMKAGKRLILCGDPKQAIYGFAGADSDSIPRMIERLSDTPQGCETLPLTVTRRCGFAIVKEAQKLVPDFEAHETCPKGLILHAPLENQLAADGYRESVKDNDMILCRTNAPLVSECFKFLKAGRKANIQGKNIGQGLISTVERMKAEDVPDLVEKLSNWYESECQKERRKKNPKDSRLIALKDRYDCIMVFTEGQIDVVGVTDTINAIFTDQTSTGIRLSSVHRAKGLESDRVFILMLKNAQMPHPLAKSKWQIDQESNLKYVAITRAKEELIYVTD